MATRSSQPEHVVLTSGFRPELVQALRAHWRITDLPVQREALAFVRQLKEQPACLVIGNASELSSAEGAADLSAWQMLEDLRRFAPDLPVIVSTKLTTPQVIVRLGRAGAFDFVAEPHSSDDVQQLALHEQALRLAIERAVQMHRVRQENVQLRNALDDEGLQGAYGSVVARSAAMLAVMDLAEKVAPTPATVLITGESGTGKELLARHIHQRSRAADKGFTAINCGALSESLLAAELFGSTRGSFTGAVSDREGLLRQARTGTLFLDEITTVVPSFQVMLLRVLEERRARPVGGTGDYPVACRFIAAANRDLEQMVRQGTFREDLWYRLNVFHIHLPPLRQRREEIPILAQRFLGQLSRHYRKAVEGFEPAAMDLLERHDWPGNVRQLRNAVERALIVAEGRRITAADVGAMGDQSSVPSSPFSGSPAAPPVPPAPISVAPARSGSADQPGDLPYHAALERYERDLVLAALRRCRGNLAATARHLNLKRTTLQYRLRRLGLSLERSWSEEPRPPSPMPP